MVIYYNNKPVYIFQHPNNLTIKEERVINVSECEKINMALDNLNVDTEAVLFTGNTIDELIDCIKNVTVHIIAAGGIVVRDDNMILVIKRNDVWDLPKGKLEEGEEIIDGARREIEEECGVEVKILKPLRTTFHFYDHKGKRVFKETRWFLSTLISEENIKPQLEEGITEIRWISKNDLPEIYSNTYSNIKDVLEDYFNSVSGN